MTPKQTEVYNYLLAYFKKNGVLPVQREIADAMGVSRQRAHQYLVELEGKKMLKSTTRYGHYVIHS